MNLPISKNIQLIMFDLDGTLVDSAPGLTQAVDAMLVELGHPAAGIDKVRHWIGRGALSLVQFALADAKACPVDNLTDTESSKALACYQKHYQLNCKSGSVLYPGAKECLEALKQRGYRLAVVTNKTGRFVPPILQDQGIDGLIELIVAGDTCSDQKPQPGMLLHSLKHFSLKPEQALMVGDSEHDINAAKAAQVATVAVSYGYNHGRCVSEFAPDGIIDSLLELIA